MWLKLVPAWAMAHDLVNWPTAVRARPSSVTVVGHGPHSAENHDGGDDQDDGDDDDVGRGKRCVSRHSVRPTA